MTAGSPLATYRLQLTREFGFDAAARIVPYLRSLGISHVYVSPILKARAGSTHGYDVVDHSELNPELGGEEAFERLIDALREAGLGLILDFVPNHMAIGYADNPWWLDVLEWGVRSPYACFFDIDWRALPSRRREGVLLPILGKSYGAALEAGEIELKFDAREGSFSAWYFGHRLPIRPDRYGEILRTLVRAAGAESQPAGKDLLALVGVCGGAHSLSYRDASQFKGSIAGVRGGAEVIASGLKAYRASPGKPAAIRALHRLLQRQHYRLAHWRLAGTQINYRRFFDINELAGLRIERQETFEKVHPVVRRLVSQGKLQGIRLDHIDGLRDPAEYCRILQHLVRTSQPASTPFYVAAEKILGEGEHLPRFAGVSGTTGYDCLNAISRVLLEDCGLESLEDCRQEMTGNTQPFEKTLRSAKLLVMEHLLASEFRMLTRLLERIAAGHYSTQDFSATSLSEALKTFVTELPVYRTYVTPDGAPGADRRLIGHTIRVAQAQLPGREDVFQFLGRVLTLDLVCKSGRYSRRRAQNFVSRFQQFTGPVMAKAMEDTAFYRFHRLIALNEVGGRPDARGLAPTGFHKCMLERARLWPHAMTSTDTHDSKRGEDARARILAIAELAAEWRKAVREWQACNRNLVTEYGTRKVPSTAHEYLFYQALIGAWPLKGIDQDFVARMQAFAIKAAREGKEQTSWLSPDSVYEQNLKNFIAGALNNGRSPEFLQSFGKFALRTALLGALNSLAQVTLKLTMPGVPDIYQGTELWNLSFVDPDNRRPVDFSIRQEALSRTTRGVNWGALAGKWPDGELKLALTWRLLALRRELSRVFTEGQYQPLDVVGRDSDHAIAFARCHESDAVVVVVGRHFADKTERGRHWPTPAVWDAAVALGNFALDADPEQSHWLLAQAFDPIPVAICRATRT